MDETQHLNKKLNSLILDVFYSENSSNFAVAQTQWYCPQFVEKMTEAKSHSFNTITWVIIAETKLCHHSPQYKLFKLAKASRKLNSGV